MYERERERERGCTASRGTSRVLFAIRETYVPLAMSATLMRQRERERERSRNELCSRMVRLSVLKSVRRRPTCNMSPSHTQVYRQKRCSRYSEKYI